MAKQIERLGWGSDYTRSMTICEASPSLGSNHGSRKLLMGTMKVTRSLSLKYRIGLTWVVKCSVALIFMVNSKQQKKLPCYQEKIFMCPNIELQNDPSSGGYGHLLETFILKSLAQHNTWNCHTGNELAIKKIAISKILGLIETIGWISMTSSAIPAIELHCIHC